MYFTFINKWFFKRWVVFLPHHIYIYIYIYKLFLLKSITMHSLKGLFSDEVCAVNNDIIECVNWFSMLIGWSIVTWQNRKYATRHSTIGLITWLGLLAIDNSWDQMLIRFASASNQNVNWKKTRSGRQQMNIFFQTSLPGGPKIMRICLSWFFSQEVDIPFT